MTSRSLFCAARRRIPFRSLLEVHEFDVEDKLASGQRVISVERDGIIRYFRDRDGYLVAVGQLQAELHADLRLCPEIEPLARDLLDERFDALAVGVISFDLDGLFIA